MIYIVGGVFLIVLLMFAWDLVRFWNLDQEMEERARRLGEEWLEEQEGKSS